MKAKKASGFLLFFSICLSPLFGSGVSVSQAFGATLETNAVAVQNAPSWLTAARVEKVTERIQRFLEWDIRRVQARFHSDPSEFLSSSGLNSSLVLAYSRKQDGSVHLGPRITSENFDGIFGHELAHVILFQKYKDAIPKWLEEGLANYASRAQKVDYAWLGQQKVGDVTLLSHPIQGGQTKVHYQASTALMELIASRCAIDELLQLSVGKKLERYLSTFCSIDDINAEFQKWVKARSGSR